MPSTSRALDAVPGSHSGIETSGQRLSGKLQNVHENLEAESVGLVSMRIRLWIEALHHTGRKIFSFPFFPFFFYPNTHRCGITFLMFNLKVVKQAAAVVSVSMVLKQTANYDARTFLDILGIRISLKIVSFLPKILLKDLDPYC
jgi:hypothetical protein